MKKFLVSLLVTLAASTAIHAQYLFKGKIVNASQQPIAGVNLLINKNVAVGVTDIEGRYSFQFSEKQFQIQLSHVGYLTRIITVDSILAATITLQQDIGLEEEAIVKAFERNGNNRTVAAAVTVLTKNNLERLGTSSLVAAVNAVPGVKMDERSPGSYRLSIRGNLLRSTFGVRNVKVYWNGIPFTDASGNTYLNQVAPGNLSQMEIIKGPSGSMYGSGTGGVVLLSSGSNNSVPGKAVEVQVTGGSYGLLSGHAAYQQSGVHTTNVSLSHLQADGYRQHARMRRDVAHYNGNYKLTSKHSLGTNIFLSDLFYQTPGGLNAAEMAANPKQSRPAAGAFKSAQTQQAAIYLKTFYAGLSSSLQVNEQWKLTTGVYGSYTDFKNPTIRNYEKKYEKGFGGRTVLQYNSGSFTGTFGGEMQQGFFYTGVYGNKSGQRDTLQFNAQIETRQSNIFAQASFNLGFGLLAEAGVSYNDFSYDYSKQSPTININEQSSFTAQVVPRFSLLKKAGASSIYVAVSKGYSVPSIDEVFAGNDVFNKSLKAETALNYEAGTKAVILKNKLWLDAAFYVLQLQNTIVSRRDSGGGDFYTNAGNTSQKGAELSVNYLPVNRVEGFIRTFKLSSHYTYINAKFKNYQQGAIQFGGNKLTGTPPNVFVLQVDLQSAPGLYCNLSYNFTDHIPLNNANRVYASSYQLSFVKLGYKTFLRPGIETNFFLAAEKSFNNPYSLGNDLNAAAGRFFNPAAPQSFSLGVVCRFRLKPATFQP